MRGCVKMWECTMRICTMTKTESMNCQIMWVCTMWECTNVSLHFENMYFDKKSEYKLSKYWECIMIICTNMSPFYDNMQCTNVSLHYDKRRYALKEYKQCENELYEKMHMKIC